MAEQTLTEMNLDQALTGIKAQLAELRPLLPSLNPQMRPHALSSIATYAKVVGHLTSALAIFAEEARV